MKKLFVGLFLLMFSAANAQDTATTVGQEIKEDAKAAGHGIKKGVKATGRAVGRGAKAAGRKTAEIASKGHSEIADKTFDGKVGPNGETVYINNKSKYYWVDKKGHRHYVEETELKDKQD
jgi:hypothetical protein